MDLANRSVGDRAEQRVTTTTGLLGLGGTVRGMSQSVTANAEPTKEFFAYVLTKDISLIASIMDLIDNSVDGARRQRSDGDFTGLKIELAIGKKSFEIADNCGGIPLDRARDYAFRFGRPPNAGFDSHSTGQFGVGMKRALFKLGEAFHIESTADNSTFSTDVRIDSWLSESAWEFPLIVDSGRTEEADRGTTIRVQPLWPALAKELGKINVRNQLRSEIANRHQISIGKGLTIRIDGGEIEAPVPEIVADRRIHPVIFHLELDGDQDSVPVDVRVVSGVIDAPQRDGGWSVFLNDRMVLYADKTGATGWGEKDEKRIPRFHGQYGRFRGYAFLDCEDTAKLPWNTTKTGLDEGDAIYRRLRSVMVQATEPVVRFLDNVKKEADGLEDRTLGALRNAIETGATKPVLELAAQAEQLDPGDRKDWKAPALRHVKVEKSTTRVCFDAAIRDVEAAKEVLDVETKKELGDRVFDYFVRAEL